MKNLGKVVGLGALLGASVVVGIRYAIKYGYIAGQSHWARNRVHDPSIVIPRWREPPRRPATPKESLYDWHND